MAKAKREIRILVASGDMAAVVDRGADVDTDIKNLGFEDKGIKAKLADTFGGQMADGETSLRLAGTKAAALLSAVDSAKLDYGAERFSEVRKAMDSGLLDGFVETKLALVVPPTDVDRAAEVLANAGLNASVAETVTVEAETLRSKVPGSKEQADAVAALKACVKVDRTYRVKYEKIAKE